MKKKNSHNEKNDLYEKYVLQFKEKLSEFLNKNNSDIPFDKLFYRILYIYTNVSFIKKTFKCNDKNDDQNIKNILTNEYIDIVTIKQKLRLLKKIIELMLNIHYSNNNVKKKPLPETETGLNVLLFLYKNIINEKLKKYLIDMYQIKYFAYFLNQKDNHLNNFDIIYIFTTIKPIFKNILIELININEIIFDKTIEYYLCMSK